MVYTIYGYIYVCVSVCACVCVCVCVCVIISICVSNSAPDCVAFHLQSFICTIIKPDGVPCEILRTSLSTLSNLGLGMLLASLMIDDV